jgi:hypothetical protein
VGFKVIDEHLHGHPEHPGGVGGGTGSICFVVRGKRSSQERACLGARPAVEVGREKVVADSVCEEIDGAVTESVVREAGLNRLINVTEEVSFVVEAELTNSMFDSRFHDHSLGLVVRESGFTKQGPFS